jgi:hypothetical protein
VPACELRRCSTPVVAHASALLSGASCAGGSRRRASCRSRLPRATHTRSQGDCDAKMAWFLPRLGAVLADPESAWADWQAEYSQVCDQRRVGACVTRCHSRCCGERQRDGMRLGSAPAPTRHAPPAAPHWHPAAGREWL